MTLDPYSPNALADQVRASNPERFDAVAAVKDPPKMFGGGTSDVPAFTASGIDPQLLLKLPVGARHAMAVEPDVRKVLDFFETYADIPEIELECDGLMAAKARMQEWLQNTDLDTRSPEQREADEDAEYAQFFNPTNDRSAWLAEDKRRREAGEPGLPDFGTGEMDRFWQKEMAG